MAANCPPLADRTLYRRLPALDLARFHKTSGGGGFLASVRLLGGFCRRPRLTLHLQGINPPSSIVIRSSSIKSRDRKIFYPPQAAAAATVDTVDEEKFGSLLSSPLMIVPPLSKAKEEDDCNDYFHLSSKAKEEDDYNDYFHLFGKANEEEEEDEEDYNGYFHFFSVADQKKYRVRKNLGLKWQREYLTPDNAACIGSTHGWLVFLDPRNCYLYLLNPFIIQNSSSHCHHNHLPYIPLPSLETLEIVKGFRILKSDHLSPSTSLIRDFLMTDWEEEYNSPPSEAVLSHYIQDVVLSSSPSSTQCTATAVMNYCGDLYFCKLGVGERWTLLTGELSRAYSDLIYFSKDGRFYALGEDEHHQLGAWDLTDHSCPKYQLIDPTFSSPRMIPEMIDHYQSSNPWSCFVKYLVESSGDLLLVFRFFDTEFVPGEEDSRPMFHRTLRFVVHKLNFNLNKWESLECLNDRALFVGYNHSYSLSTRDYPELRGNSIYFTENYEELHLMCNTGHDNGVFHLEDNSITYYCTHDWKRIEPHSLLVPSPVWVCNAQNNAR